MSRSRLFVSSIALTLAIAAALVPLGAAAAVPSPVACDVTKGPCWHPIVGSRWQYQLQGVAAYASTGGINVNISAVPISGGAAVRPQVFDVDLYVDQAVSGNNTTLNTTAVSAIHANGAKAICYLSAGTWENWRVDAAQFPAPCRAPRTGGPARNGSTSVRRRCCCRSCRRACRSVSRQGSTAWSGTTSMGTRTGQASRSPRTTNWSTTHLLRTSRTRTA